MMKFLCLHGSGTNTEIFAAQTAAIRHQLGGGHTYEFVQGNVTWPLAPGKFKPFIGSRFAIRLSRYEITPVCYLNMHSSRHMWHRIGANSILKPRERLYFDTMTGLESLASPDAGYWSVWDWDLPESHMKALNDLEKYIAMEGPFDGVLGYSSGASLAAMHLVRQALRNPPETPSFRCAVFLNCTGVYDPIHYVERGEVLRMHREDFGEIIQIPVANIWGEQDVRKADCDMVNGLCQSSTRASFVHDGGHEIPGLTNIDAVQPVVKAIKRVIIHTLS